MSSYAKIENGAVVNIIEATPEFIAQVDGVHVEAFPEAQGEAVKRFNYPQSGDHYDEENDAFYSSVAPYPSWSMSATYQWEAPTPKPEGDTPYIWDEETLSWVAV